MIEKVSSALITKSIEEWRLHRINQLFAQTFPGAATQNCQSPTDTMKSPTFTPSQSSTASIATNQECQQPIMSPTVSSDEMPPQRPPSAQLSPRLWASTALGSSHSGGDLTDGLVGSVNNRTRVFLASDRKFSSTIESPSDEIPFVSGPPCRSDNAGLCDSGVGMTANVGDQPDQLFDCIDIEQGAGDVLSGWSNWVKDSAFEPHTFRPDLAFDLQWQQIPQPEQSSCSV